MRRPRAVQLARVFRDEACEAEGRQLRRYTGRDARPWEEALICDECARQMGLRSGPAAVSRGVEQEG